MLNLNPIQILQNLDRTKSTKNYKYFDKEFPICKSIEENIILNSFTNNLNLIIFACSFIILFF